MKPRYWRIFPIPDSMSLKWQHPIKIWTIHILNQCAFEIKIFNYKIGLTMNVIIKLHVKILHDVVFNFYDEFFQGEYFVGYIKGPVNKQIKDNYNT